MELDSWRLVSSIPRDWSNSGFPAAFLFERTQIVFWTFFHSWRNEEAYHLPPEAPRESAAQLQWEEDWRDDIYTAGGLHVFLSDDGYLGRKVRRRLNMVSTWLNDDGDGGGGDDDDYGGGGGGVDGYM